MSRATNLTVAALVGALTIGAATVGHAQQPKMDEITVTISRVMATSKIDQLSRADFFARVTIAGETFTTVHIPNRDVIRPNWTFKKKVPRGTHDIKLAIFDRDVTKEEIIDINRVRGKKDLDFKVNTANCLVLGFATPTRCGTPVTRAGVEGKRAQVTFSVSVKR